MTTIGKYTMIEQGDTVAVAVSGGADSITLLHLLFSLRKTLQITVVAAHLNHQLRGGESVRDAEFVARLCEKLEIPLYTEAIDVASIAREKKLSIEECARDERYAFFRRACPEAKIATGHTADDNAETILLNLARGTSLRGLCGIPPVRDGIIRPLIDCSREDIERYCAENSLDFVTDSTNLSDDYTRNRLRHRAMPALKEVNPALPRAVSGMTQLLRQDADYLDSLAISALTSLEHDSGFNRERYLALHPSISSRILILLLRERGLPYHREGLALMDKIIRNGGALSLGDGFRLKSSGDLFSIQEDFTPQPYFEHEIHLQSLTYPCEITLFDGKRLKITLADCKNFENISKPSIISLKNALDYDKIDWVVLFRQRRPGDSIRLTGRGCSKTLKKLMNEAAVPLRERSRVAVLEANGLVLWAEGFGASERAAVTSDTKRMILLETINTHDIGER